MILQNWFGWELVPSLTQMQLYIRYCMSGWSWNLLLSDTGYDPVTLESNRHNTDFSFIAWTFTLRERKALESLKYLVDMSLTHSHSFLLVSKTFSSLLLAVRDGNKSLLRRRHWNRHTMDPCVCMCIWEPGESYPWLFSSLRQGTRQKVQTNRCVSLPKRLLTTTATWLCGLLVSNKRSSQW